MCRRKATKVELWAPVHQKRATECPKARSRVFGNVFAPQVLPEQGLRYRFLTLDSPFPAALQRDDYAKRVKTLEASFTPLVDATEFLEKLPLSPVRSAVQRAAASRSEPRIILPEPHAPVSAAPPAMYAFTVQVDTVHDALLSLAPLDSTEQPARILTQCGC